jgi:hypothetical protein
MKLTFIVSIFLSLKNLSKAATDLTFTACSTQTAPGFVIAECSARDRYVSLNVTYLKPQNNLTVIFFFVS